jgi:mono/diheme cytochrome c family protein
MRLASAWLVLLPAGPVGAAEGVEHFEKRVRPVLIERCYECHSTASGKSKGGLLLDSREGWSRGGDSGPAIVPGSPEQSLLIKAVRWADPDTQMPPKNKLSESEIEALVKWVRDGAPDPRSGERTDRGRSTPPPSATGTNHWAYQPVGNPAPPSVRKTSWPRNGIDAFIAARLEQAGLAPAADATPEVLCRRLYFDLTGLPPTPEQLASARRPPPGSLMRCWRAASMPSIGRGTGWMWRVSANR